MTDTTMPRRAVGLHHGWQYLDTAAAWRRAAWLAPLLFGLLSLLVGQDYNWDLRNYHLYNPFALLNGKIGYDLAPGQWQSYFNPTLDLLYYGLVMHLPAPLVGFLMGALHGVNFVLLAAIVLALLPAGSAHPRRLALLLALAGCAGPGFLSGLGNTMGDNLTALGVLGALLLLLRQWPRLRQGAPLAALGAGVLMGAAAGLKLTNAVYALALCLALFALDGDWRRRCQAAFVFGVGVLGGMAVTGGHWYWRMWQQFGNPLFPQFNDRFGGPLAAPIGVGDARWLPQGALEKLLWPFIHTLHPQRVSELPLRHLLWPMLYVAFAALALALAARWARGPDAARAPAATAPPQRLLLAFVALSYGLWLHLFSIYRYLVPVELLAPLALWLLLHALMAPAAARRWGTLCLLLAACSVASVSNWGHTRWALRAFSVETPSLPHPEQNLVFIVHNDPPMGWLVPFFSERLAFVSLGGGFPESPAYVARARAMLAARRGPFYAMLYAEAPPRKGWPDAAARARAEQAGRERLARGAATLEHYGLALDAASCRQYGSASGTHPFAYRLCQVAPRP
nr:glycosyltransferase 87 family protein [uncultured Duganella sp.]